ncbi:MAG: hypothetical protein AB7S38_34805, partial [Vulcanimicrobiota bacterium]
DDFVVEKGAGLRPEMGALASLALASETLSYSTLRVVTLARQAVDWPPPGHFRTEVRPSRGPCSLA